METEQISYRSFNATEHEDKTIRGIAATEYPVHVLDTARGKVLPEVLVMSGAILPPDNTVALLDNHNRRSTKDQLGSAVCSLDGPVMPCVLNFSSAENATEIKTREKHTNGLSIGCRYRLSDKEFVPAGKTYILPAYANDPRSEAERTISGPANIIKRFIVDEVSLTIKHLHADSHATVRKSDFGNISEGDINTSTPLNILGDTPLMQDVNETPAQEETNRSKLPEAQVVDTDAIVKEKFAERMKFYQDVKELCTRNNVADAAESICESCTTREDAYRKILDAQAERAPKVNISFGRSHNEKQSEAMQDGLTARMLDDAMGFRSAKLFPEEKRATGWEFYRGRRLIDIAAECLENSGVNTRHMGYDQIAETAIGLRAGSYLTSGNFPALMLNAQNKVLLSAYNEAPSTWEAVFRKGSSVKDYKDKQLIRSSAVPNLTMWAPNDKPQEVLLSDKRQPMLINRYGLTISIDSIAIINDDLGGISDTVSRAGNAARRSVNASAWGMITANGALSDGVAFFHSTHANTKSTGLSPRTSEISAMRKLMRLQTGLSGELLNATPRVLAVPAAIESEALTLVNSEYDPTASLFQAFNPNRGLTVVCEPLLDSNSATAYYLFGTGNESVGEVAFLQGEETPQIDGWVDPSTRSYKWTVRQSWGVALVDYQYGVHNAGTGG